MGRSHSVPETMFLTSTARSSRAGVGSVLVTETPPVVFTPLMVTSPPPVAHIPMICAHRGMTVRLPVDPLVVR